MKNSAANLILILSSAALSAAPVFKIGKPDARAAEFNSFNTDFNTNSYYYPVGSDPFSESKKFFSKPFVFEVGKNKDSDFPFVLPVRRCEWADISYARPKPDDTFYFVDGQYRDAKAKYHPVSIKFNLPEKPSKTLFLKIGLVDHAPRFINGTALEISVNGKSAGTFEVPYKYDAEENPFPCFSNIVLNSKTWGVPESLKIEIPADMFDAGGNTLSIKALPAKQYGGEEWVAFDYIELADDSAMPKVENPLPEASRRAAASLDFDKIVFSMRGMANDAHWYGSFGFYPDTSEGYTEKNTPMRKLRYSKLKGMMDVNPPDARTDPSVFAHDGGILGVLDVKTGAASALLADPEGDVRNPCVHFDGGKIMYSYRRGGESHYDIYECAADGSDKKKLPLSDPKFDDFESTYLPNGDIAFISTRCERTVPCWMTDVGIMYRYFADEGVVRPISANVDQDNSPWPCSDGNIIYMRWEYVQRSQLNFHALWKKSPDASYDMVYFGNDIPNHLLIDAKEVEGVPNKFAFTFINDHGDRDHRGRIAVIDAPSNPGDVKAFRFVTGNEAWRAGNFPLNSYTSPFPVGKNYILAACEGRFIALTDYEGHVLKTFRLPKDFKAFDNTYVMEVFPLRKRARGLVKPDMADYEQKDATVVVVDASIGRNMQGVRQGDIKKLMINEVLPDMFHLYGGTEPFSLRGAFNCERYIGTVDVESDGSAHFKVPANRALSFVALDKDGRVIRRMQSFTSFAPGSTTSCIGCHEYRDMAPPPIKEKLKALLRPADSPAPIKGAPQGEVLDYVRDIQPILDAHCVKCHNPRDYKGKTDLSAGMGPMFPLSYYRLRALRQIRDGCNRNGNLPPYEFGSGGSKMMNKISGSHHGAKLSEDELNRVKIWLDTGGTAAESNACWQSGVLVYYYSNVRIVADENWPENAAMAKVIDEKCASCHAGVRVLPRMLSGGGTETPPHLWLWDIPKSSPKNRLSSHAVFNTSFPENSHILLAPLAASAGGRAKDGGHPVIFKDKNDPNYRTILAAVERAKKYIDEENPRYTSPNYTPQGGYYWALKRRGIINEGDDLKNFDAFKADKKYWDKVTGAK